MGQGSSAEEQRTGQSRIPGNSTGLNGSDGRSHATALENTQEKCIHLSRHESKIVAVNRKITKIQAR